MSKNMLLFRKNYNPYKIYSYLVERKSSKYTRDRMINFQMQTPDGCLLCNGRESIIHLFSDCPYFDLIRRACPVDFSHNWTQCQTGAIFHPAISKRQRLIGSLYLSVAVYLVWKERNFRLHNHGPGHASFHVISQLKRIVREKLFTCVKFKKWVREDNQLTDLLY